MKRVSMKVLTAAVLVTSIVCTAGVGTYAKYAITKQSVNTIQAAHFDIGPSGNSFENAKFTIDKLNPMSETKEFPIVINKNKTNVDTKYTLSLKTDETKNAIFIDKDKYTSPIKFKLQRKVGNEYKTVVEDFKNKPFELNDLNEADKSLKPNAVEEFKLICLWDSKNDENDTAYQGLNGDFNVTFAAEQVKDVIKPFEPKIVEVAKFLTGYTYYKQYEAKPIELHNIKSYKNSNELNVVEIEKVVSIAYGDYDDQDINIQKLRFMQKEKGSNKYIVSTTNDLEWNNKEFEYTTNWSTGGHRNIFKMNKDSLYFVSETLYGLLK